jgi:hypothetical protein
MTFDDHFNMADLVGRAELTDIVLEIKSDGIGWTNGWGL